MSNYATETIIDMHQCELSTFNPNALTKAFGDVCAELGVVIGEIHYSNPATIGALKISAVMFVEDGDVLIRLNPDADEERGAAVHVNVFFKKPYDDAAIRQSIVASFGGTIVNRMLINRY